MNKIIKRIATGLSAAVITVAMPAAAMAYGPTEGTDGRKYFDYKDTATYPNYPAFNSFKNSPTWGFEPDFMSIREAGANNPWNPDDMISLEAGKTYDVVVFYHNNAPKDQYPANDTKMKIEFPAYVKSGESIKGTASINASNSTPKSVWSTLTFKSENDMLIRYKQDSAFIQYSGGAKKNLPNAGKDLFASGQLLGKNLDGVVPGCDAQSGFVQFQIVADQPNFTLEKQVRLVNSDGTKGAWSESVTAQPGSVVDFLITYKNTGTIQQNNVVIKDILPEYLTYVQDSTMIYNATNPVASGGLKDITNDIAGIGVNVGNYSPGADAAVKFSVKIADEKALKCGTNTLTNTGRVVTDNGAEEDTAVVIVVKNCVTDTPKELPKTGPASIVGAVVGAGSIVTAASYYIISRKKLN